MGKNAAVFHSRRKGEGRAGSTALLMISCGFLFGGILGWLLESNLSSGAYVRAFLDAIKDGAITPEIPRVLWSICRWPLLVMVAGILPLAGLGIPAVLCLRGFLLSYSISAFFDVGIKEAAMLFGPVCLLTLPVLFLLAEGILLKKAGEPTERKPAVVLACLLSLALCAVLELTVIPILLS